VLAGFLAIRALMTAPLASLVATFESWLEFRGVLSRADDVLSQPVPRRGCESVRAARGRLDLENVGFRFGGGSPWVFRGVSLRIEPGENVVLTGASGQGKSTLLRVLAGILEPTEGRVLIDGVDLRACDPDSLARVMGVLAAPPLILEGDVRANVALRLPDATDAEVWAAAVDAGFDEVVQRLPQGYESRLEPNGQNLSGGERQRLGIAQALLGNPQVILLDEATCFLDSALEARLVANIARRGATTVSVAHRPALIAAASRIVVLQAGRVEWHTSMPHEGQERLLRGDPPPAEPAEFRDLSTELVTHWSAP
jgi:ABC-type bacteriocin/lantibiotic exporter with double-glycine peptidase domain